MFSLRALTPSLTRITIASAVGAALYMGQGNTDIIDQKAVEFSRAVLSQMEIDGEIISCEGPIDNAPAFETREKVGRGIGPKLEFVIDPVDGTTATAMGRKDAISALACAPKGCLQALPDDGYYFKIATGPEARGRISLDMPLESIVKEVAVSKNKLLKNFTVIMLDRKRHRKILKRLRALGVRIVLVPDGDIAGSVATCLPETGIDLLVGAGKGPEATIAATALKCLGGTMLVNIWRGEKHDENRDERLKAAGVDVDKTYTQDDLARGDQLAFVASGITKGELLEGVKFIPGGAIVHSLCTRLPSGTMEKSTTYLRFIGHPVYEHII